MNHLKELRNKKKVSQQIVAEYLDISRQAYSNYENGTREPDFETLLKLGEFFDCSIDYILRGENGQKEAPVQNTGATDDEIRFALFGTHDEITDELMEDVKAYAHFKLEQKRKGK